MLPFGRECAIVTILFPKSTVQCRSDSCAASTSFGLPFSPYTGPMTNDVNQQPEMSHNTDLWKIT